MKIALLPGGFKPPHLGHYNMAKYLADFADNVIVRIGQKEREGIGAPLALEVWNFYKEFDPDPRAKKLTISVAQSPSPVKDVYDFVEKIAPEGSTVILGLGEKDAADGRYNSIPKFAEPRNIKAEIELVPPQAGGISGTRMREIIKTNDKAEFFKYIPDYLPEEIKEEIWTKVQDTTMPSDISEGITNYIPAIGKIKNLSKTLYSTKHLPQGSPENRTPEEEAEYRDILDNKRDAFRHILASAYFTTKIGGFLTKGTGETLELIGALKSKLKGGPFDSGWDMDSSNNQLGVNLGKQNPDASFNELVSLTQKIIQSGNFYTSDGKTLHKNLKERISFQSDIDAQDIEFLDAQADADMDPVDIDLTSQHFFDRLNDPRNYPNIELDELELFFAKLADKKEEFIEFLNQYKTVVAKDRQTDINIPFMKLANKAIAKTIMRKRNFQTPDPVLPLEEFMGGTMNKQEMDKHNANMKKLRKFFSKQGDQMVQIPTKLTKGLKRKLYEKFGIQRGTIESETQFISREIFELFKTHIGKPYEEEGIEGYIEGGEVVLEFEVAVEFIPTNDLPGFSFDAEADDENIEIRITYNPAIFPDEYNNLNAELKETLRHEIEHVTQFGFDLKNYFEEYKGEIDFYKYLMLHHEIPAFVRGLYKRAKFKKMSLSDAFDDFFDDYIESFNNPKEIEQVKRVWTNWAKSNLPAARIGENFPPYKANQVQQTRYKASDTFTNDRKKAKKLGYVEEMKLFSKEWWSDIIMEELLNEGGAAGHMAHPFDLPNVNTGKDLIKSFEKAADSLKKEPGSVKIDGVNASIRLINNAGKRQFAMDRGSKKELDLRGVTKADLEARFGAGHGMIKAGGDVLDIFNDAIPSIQEELEALGLWDNPNIMFNMEYVSGKSNVQDYGKNFLAIHGLLEVETKEVQGARGMLTKRVTSEKQFAQSDMDELLKKLEPFAKKKGFEIYGSVPTTFTKDPDFKSALGKNYTIDFAEGDKTKSLAQWLNDVTSIPKTDRLKMNVNGAVKDVGALSKQVYFAVFGGENVDDLFDSEQDVQKAIQGATTYLATEKLGDAILDVLDSPMGSVNDHEGVVIRDSKISSRPFKITGKFITGGVSSQFQQK